MTADLAPSRTCPAEEATRTNRELGREFKLSPSVASDLQPDIPDKYIAMSGVRSSPEPRNVTVITSPGSNPTPDPTPKPFNPNTNAATALCLLALLSPSEDDRVAAIGKLVGTCVRYRRMQQKGIGVEGLSTVDARDYAEEYVLQFLAPYRALSEAEIRAAAANGAFRYIVRRFIDRWQNRVRDVLNRRRLAKFQNGLLDPPKTKDGDSLPNSPLEYLAELYAQPELHSPSRNVKLLMKRLDIATALKKMPRDLTDPLLLHYVDELSIPQIAQELQLSEGVVRGRISRARKLFRLLFLGACRNEQLRG